MKLVLQRRIDRYLGTPLCLFLSLLNYLQVKKNIPLLQPKKILVILLSEMGSVVLAKPMFDHIQTAHPSAEIFVLVFKKNEELVKLLNLAPDKNIISIRDTTLPEFVSDSIKAVIKMRQVGIDAVLDCELFSRIGSIVSFLSGAKLRVGFYPYTQEGLYRGSFINRRVIYNPYVHISQQFVSLAESLESNTVPLMKRQLEGKPFTLAPIPLDRRDVEKWKLKFESDFPAIVGSKLIALYPSGGLLPLRAWPIDHYCAIAKNFIANGYAVGVIGLNHEKILAETILSYCDHNKCIDLTGYTKTIRELLFILQYSILLATNDSGPGHFAALVQTPTVILYGPETPVLYASLSEKTAAIYHDFSCSPCLTAYNHRNSPCDGDNICLKSITVAEVLYQSYGIIGKNEGEARFNRNICG